MQSISTIIFNGVVRLNKATERVVTLYLPLYLVDQHAREYTDENTDD